MHQSGDSELPDAGIRDKDRYQTPFAAPGADAPLQTIILCEQLVASDGAAAAKQLLLSLENVTPDSEEEWKRLHSLCLRLNERTRAQVYTERFLRGHKDSATAHLANARNFISLPRDWPRVKESMTAALSNPGTDKEFWREVATLQFSIHENEAACISARKAISLDPGDVEMRELLISALGILQRLGEIRRECAQLADCLVQSKQNDPLLWARLSRIAAEAGARKQARSYIDSAAECLSGVNYGADFELTRALILTSQPKRAMIHLQHLVEDNSQNTWLWNTLVDMAMLRRYYDIALIAIRQLKAIPHQDPEFLYRLSRTEQAASKARGSFLSRFIRRLRRYG